MRAGGTADRKFPVIVRSPRDIVCNDAAGPRHRLDNAVEVRTGRCGSRALRQDVGRLYALTSLDSRIVPQRNRTCTIVRAATKFDPAIWGNSGYFGRLPPPFRWGHPGPKEQIPVRSLGDFIDCGCASNPLAGTRLRIGPTVARCGVGHAHSVERSGESARHPVRRLEDSTLRKIGMAEPSLNVGMTESAGDDPQTLAGADCDSRLGVAEVDDAQPSDNQVRPDCLPQRPESGRSAVIGCEYSGTDVAGRQTVLERARRRRLPDGPRPRLADRKYSPVVMDVLPPHIQRLGLARARVEREALQTPDEGKRVCEIQWRLGLTFE